MNTVSHKNRSQNINNYSKLTTSGNNPKISSRATYSHNMRNARKTSSGFITPELTLEDQFFVFDDEEIPVHTFILDAQTDSPGEIFYKSSNESIILVKGNVASILGTGQVIIYVIQNRYQKMDFAKTQALFTVI